MLNPNKYVIAENLRSNKLGEYYFIFREKQMENQKGGQKSMFYDEQGIPLNPTYIDVKDKDYVYFPITIGQVGLAVYHTFINTNSEEDKYRFLKFVDWFYTNAEISDKLGARWLTEVSLPQYKNPGPWQSAFSQSRGISILLRGYQLTKKEKYLELAERALVSFTMPVNQGGVTSYTNWGPFYEEYTAEAPTLVLNGMIFALCGLYDFVRVNPDNKFAGQLYNDGVKTLEKILPEYDLGYWSRYNLCQANWYPIIDPSTITYQHLHVTQFEMLYRLTAKEIFKEYASIFKKQITPQNIIRMYRQKYKSLKKIGRI